MGLLFQYSCPSAAESTKGMMAYPETGPINSLMAEIKK